MALIVYIYCHVRVFDSLYIVVGGCDIVTGLHQDGALKKVRAAQAGIQPNGIPKREDTDFCLVLLEAWYEDVRRCTKMYEDVRRCGAFVDSCASSFDGKIEKHRTRNSCRIRRNQFPFVKIIFN